MPAPVISAQDCCVECPDGAANTVPGPQGAAGTNGTNGAAGVSSFTTTSAGFTQPAVAATVVVTVATSAWAVIGQVVYVQNGGYYTVTAISDSTHLTLANLGYSVNVAPTTVIGSGQKVGPGGLVGATGGTGLGTLNTISPTTTRGDIIADNGATSPVASDVRLAAGTDGQILTAESSQPTGLLWQSVHPNASATTDNQLARYNTPVGTEEPAAIQTSAIKLTDNGALQHTGGNAKGTDAVDLSPSRAVATQVASGANSGVLSGLNNTASGARSVVGGGTTNVASGTDSTVAGGTGNTVAGNNGVCGGGNGNIASATGSCVSGGLTNTASAVNANVAGGSTNIASAQGASIAGGEGNASSGLDSAIPGGNGNIASAQDACCLCGSENRASAIGSATIGGQGASVNKYGQKGHASGYFVAPGDAQTSELIWRGATTNATPTEIFLDGAAIRATVPNNTTWAFSILATARRDTGVSVIFKVEGGIKNDAGVVVLVAAITTTVVSDGSAGALVAGSLVASADDPNNALIITVTGVAVQNWRWVAHARLVELNY